MPFLRTAVVRQGVCQDITSHPTGCDDRIIRYSTPTAVNRLRQCRSITTRYDRTAESCKAAVTSYHHSIPRVAAKCVAPACRGP